jgi:hypothetical protein
MPANPRRSRNRKKNITERRKKMYTSTFEKQRASPLRNLI